MVLGAALIEKTENKCSTYFQGITVYFLIYWLEKKKYEKHKIIIILIKFKKNIWFCKKKPTNRHGQATPHAEYDSN